MRLYVNEAACAMVGFSTATVYKVPWVDNALADALAKLAFTVPSVLGEPVVMEDLHQLIVASHTVLPISDDRTWMAIIIQYLLTGEVLPETIRLTSKG